VADRIASASAAGPPPGMAVRLSSNESPFGPSPAAVEAIRAAAAEAHRYPDDQSIALRERLARHESIDVGRVAVGTGSAALLMDVVAHACQGGEAGSVVAFERSFVVYRLAARNAGVDYLEAATGGVATTEGDGYARDVDALLELVDDRTRVVMIDNPGNPTGAHLTGEQLTALVASIPEHVTIVVDEAYHDFATGQRGYATVADLGLDHPRLLVTRTFSKAHALAGLRVGYLVGPASLVAELDAWRVRFNVTALAQAAALASLDDPDHVRACVAGTLEGRDLMADHLRRLGIPFTDGLGNFLTLELGEPAQPVVDAFARHGVGVRPLAPYGMDEQIRVSVGTPDEVDAFLATADEVLAGVASRAG
jgi:histidinol-phosphate aminotransferase